METRMNIQIKFDAISMERRKHIFMNKYKRKYCNTMVFFFINNQQNMLFQIKQSFQCNGLVPFMDFLQNVALMKERFKTNTIFVIEFLN